MPLTARIGSTLMKGLDGQMTTARKRSSPQGREQLRMRARLLRAVEGELAHRGTALEADEIILEIEPPVIRSQSGAQPIVGRRQHAGTDAEAAAEVGGDGGEGLARLEPARALEMNGKVAIAKAEPVLAAERGERLHERPRLVAPAPSELRVVEAGERVHQRVGVGRDMQAEMLEIVADIGDDDEIVAARRSGSGPARAWRRRCLRRERPPDPDSSKQILVCGTNDARRRRFRSGPA